MSPLSVRAKRSGVEESLAVKSGDVSTSLDMTNAGKTAKKFRSYRDVKKADRDFHTKLTAT